MTTTNKSQNDAKSLTWVIRAMYALSVAIGIYFLVQGRVVDAMSSLGIALIFDPFDSTVGWNARKTYQKVWLIVHVIVVFVLAGVALFA